MLALLPPFTGLISFQCNLIRKPLAAVGRNNRILITLFGSSEILHALLVAETSCRQSPIKNLCVTNSLKFHFGQVASP